jgi:uncharacterized protein YpmB
MNQRKKSFIKIVIAPIIISAIIFLSAFLIAVYKCPMINLKDLL